MFVPSAHDHKQKNAIHLKWIFFLYRVVTYLCTFFSIKNFCFCWKSFIIALFFQIKLNLELKKKKNVFRMFFYQFLPIPVKTFCLLSFNSIDVCVWNQCSEWSFLCSNVWRCAYYLCIFLFQSIIYIRVIPSPALNEYTFVFICLNCFFFSLIIHFEKKKRK